ncbi:hypothetical protein [Microbacterium sp. H1-D42]|uniref:hypothetical protein n=1 Tax=Microbacterium sp. H1-D42 TaxID=2925844 RepID=UPI001F5393C1|nr:hypothetical protein [Microbacterium sp. H1-D42]UNK70719.1 hypothetical protein MNR00_16430 [Microbacterium sp. H1-D42]
MNEDNTLTEAESAEDELRRLGLRDIRVRCCGGDAWLDAPADQISSITREPLRSEVVRVVKAAGFTHVGIGLNPR